MITPQYNNVAPGNRYPGPNPAGNPQLVQIANSLMNPRLSVSYPNQGARYGFGSLRSLMPSQRPQLGANGMNIQEWQSRPGMYGQMQQSPGQVGMGFHARRLPEYPGDTVWM